MRILAGLAIGFLAGANWKKLRPHVEPFMPVIKDAGEKASDAYTTLVKGFMSKMEEYADERAEVRHRDGQGSGSSPTAAAASTPVASANGTAPVPTQAHPVAQAARTAASLIGTGGPLSS